MRFRRTQDPERQIRELSDKASREVLRHSFDKAEAALNEMEGLLAQPGMAFPFGEYLLLMGRVQMLSGRAQFEEALEHLDGALDLAHRDPQLPAMPPSGLSGRATLLSQLGRDDEAFDAAQVAINAAETSVNERERDETPQMLILQGRIFQSRRDHPHALAAFHVALDRIAESEPHARWRDEATWRAMYGRGVSLEALGRRDAAIEAYDTFIDKFRAFNDSEAQAAVRDARTQVNSLRHGGAAPAR